MKTFSIFQNMSSIFSGSVGSDMEQDIIGPDGLPIRSNKKGQDDNISNDDSEYLRKKMLKRAGSVDTLASVEDPDNIDHRKSKRRLNEHTLTNERSGANGNVTDQEEAHGEKTSGRKANDKGKRDVEPSDRVAKSILVNVKSGDNQNEMDIDHMNGEPLRRTLNRKLFDEFSDDEPGKVSDQDSGMDENDEDVDVTLNKEQQQMIVKMLFDEEMNLRPQFYRNENGQIVVSVCII